MKKLLARIKNIVGDGFFQLQKSDLIKGLITAFTTAIVISISGTLLPMLSSGKLPSLEQFTGTLRTAGVCALGGGLGYILKNLTTNSKDQWLKKEPKPTAEDLPT